MDVGNPPRIKFITGDPEPDGESVAIEQSVEPGYASEREGAEDMDLPGAFDLDGCRLALWSIMNINII